jgi:hypothetical protein
MVLINDTTCKTLTGYISADGGELVFEKWTWSRQSFAPRPRVGIFFFEAFQLQNSAGK